jgi:hypothetical protein
LVTNLLTINTLSCLYIPLVSSFLPLVKMSAANGSAVPGETVTDSKGKGKAVEQPQSHDMSMDEDEDSSAEESGNEEPVSFASCIQFHPAAFTLRAVVPYLASTAQIQTQH